jgi:hypothetical protein
MRAVWDVDFSEIYVNPIGPESLQEFHVGIAKAALPVMTDCMASSTI